MQKFKYLIIGGGIAGTTAAETIRKKDAQSSMAIINDEPYYLYSRVMLSKPDFFFEKIPFDKIWLKDQSWYKKNKITFIGGEKASALNPIEKNVILANNIKIDYEKLLLAIGACARLWKVEGSDKQGIFQLRTLDDAKALIKASKNVKHAIAIGSAFITFEIADLLRSAGIDFTVVMLEKYYWEPILDETGGQIIEQALIKGGVKIIRKAEITKVLGNQAVSGVILKDNSELTCDMIVCGIGLFCPLEYVKGAGIKINHGIITNEYLETNLPDIWAAGDVAEFKDPISGESTQLGSWASAREQGKIAGLNMLGEKIPFKFVSTYSARGFGVNITFVGDVRPLANREFISRGSLKINSYARLFVLNKKLIGAVLINRNQEMGSIIKLIENNTDVSKKFTELADVNFDLKTLSAQH